MTYKNDLLADGIARVHLVLALPLLIAGQGRPGRGLFARRRPIAALLGQGVERAALAPRRPRLLVVAHLLGGDVHAASPRG